MLFLLAHERVVVHETGSVAVAGLLPQNARFVDEPAEDHRSGDGSQDANLDPLDAERE